MPGSSLRGGSVLSPTDGSPVSPAFAEKPAPPRIVLRACGQAKAIALADRHNCANRPPRVLGPEGSNAVRRYKNDRSCVCASELPSAVTHLVLSVRTSLCTCPDPPSGSRKGGGFDEC